MPADERKELREAMVGAQMSLGWCFPNAIMQYALPDLEGLSIDQAALARRRDRLFQTLAGSGYEPLAPEGTFYLLSRWPEGDPDRLFDALADHDVYVMPGSLLAAPEYFRISLTASDEMVERALPVFRAVGEAAQWRG